MSTKTRRYMLRFSYIGTSYRGSQKQSSSKVIDLDTVQGAIDSAFYRLWPKLESVPKSVFAGRTDAGVHALAAVAHTDLETEDGLNSDYILRMVNRYFINNGHHIRLHTFHEVNRERFHARFSAKRRTYLYRFLVAKEPNFYQIPIAEMDRTAHVHFDEFDLERLKKGIRLFVGVKDFKSFSARVFNRVDIDYRSHVKLMEHISIEETTSLMPSDPLSEQFRYYNVIFTSKSFLYNQIRRIMGALFALGAHKIEEKDIITMLQVPGHGNYYKCCTPASPTGLYLKHIEYDEEDIRKIHPDDSI